MAITSCGRCLAYPPFVEPLEDRCVPAVPAGGAVEIIPDAPLAGEAAPEQAQIDAQLLLGLSGALPAGEGPFLTGAGQPITPAGLSPFAVTVPPAFVSAFGPTTEGGVTVAPATPDQASIGFPGRIVLPGTNSLQRANLPFGPFEQSPGAFAGPGADAGGRADAADARGAPAAAPAEAGEEMQVWLDSLPPVGGPLGDLPLADLLPMPGEGPSDGKE